MAISHLAQMGCCVFLRWPNYISRHGYRTLTMDGYNSPSEDESTVRVIVGKEKRVFLVDPFVLQKDPFRVLFEMVTKEKKNERFRKKGGAIFVDIDAILFEHMLWLVYNDSSSASSTASLFELNLKEIIEFYSQDC